MAAKLGRRILIVGSGGAGKSTLARLLGERLSLPVTHLDKEFWNHGWVETPKDEWRKKQQELLSKPEWILDGNFGSSLELRLERADTVIFLDFNRFVCLCSIFKRRLANAGKTRPDMAEGCPEKIDFAALRWIWQFRSKSRPVILEKVSKCKVELIAIKSRKKLKEFVNEIGRAS